MGFRPSPGADRELRRLIAPQLLAAAVELERRAADLSPEGMRAGLETSTIPEFRDTFRHRVERGRIIVGSFSSNAHLVEFGSSTTPEFAPMRRAARSLGLRLRPLGREAGRSGRRRGGRRKR